MSVARILVFISLVLLSFVSAVEPVALAEPRSGPILVLGDSLSAAYGLDRDDGWVALLRGRLAREGYPQDVVNASVSGETTSGGRDRLPALLERHQPAIVILELGANDGLRVLPVERMQENLEAMIRMAQDAGAETLLLGMRLPSNYGPAYGAAFHEAFRKAARTTGAEFLPFFLEPIALDESYFLPDRIHPNARAQPLLLDALWPKLETLLRPANAARLHLTATRPAA